MEEKLKNILSLILSIPAESITEETSTQNIPSWDSLAHMNLIVALEGEFQIRFPEHLLPQLQDYLSIKKAIESMLNS